MVKTQGCGSCIRGFESHYPPHKISVKAEQFMMLGYRQAVRQRILIPSCAGSNPATLANLLQFSDYRGLQIGLDVWRHSQVVRQRSAKPLLPSSNLGVASREKPQTRVCGFLLGI